MSVREARAQFAAVLAAAERGEKVTITRNGKPIAELGPLSERAPAKTRDWTWDDLDRIREECGIRKPNGPEEERWLRDFNDPRWTEELFGPEYR